MMHDLNTCFIVGYVSGIGTPDTANISLNSEDNSLKTSWDYERIPTVDVALYWSLSFFSM